MNTSPAASQPGKRPQGSDPCAPDTGCIVPPAEFVRLRYFFGQRLNVVDLTDEQAYVVGKQRFHNLRAHGVGILCGLLATRYVYPQGSDPNAKTTLLRVSKGSALDSCGREIIVGWDQCIDVAAWFAQHPEAQGEVDAKDGLHLWILLCYRECPSDPSPAPRDACGCTFDGCEFARIREGFELKLITDSEAMDLTGGGANNQMSNAGPSQGGAASPTKAPSGQVGTASIANVGSGPAGTAAVTKGASSQGGGASGRVDDLFAALECSGPPANQCLFLAAFEATLDSTGKKVIDISQPDNAIPERLTLLPVSLLQHGLLYALNSMRAAELVGAGPVLTVGQFHDGGTDSGTYSISIETAGPALSRDPFAAPAQMEVHVMQFDAASGSWEAAPAFTSSYNPGPPMTIDIKFASGLADGGRYRVYLKSDQTEPPVDQQMQPLTPPTWAHHFRLVKDPSSGNLVLADSLF